jgi:hypothetical protein
MPPQSILAYLASRWTSQLENVVTDGLAYLLNQYPDVFKALREYVSLTGTHLPDSLKLETQATGVFAGRPDMVGADDEDRHVLIIESKFWATLTSNQPMGYVGELPLNKPAILLFIAPEARLSDLWRELMERCGERGTPKEAPSPFRVLAVDVPSSRILALTSWESLLTHLEARQPNDSAAAEDIRQLQSLCAGKVPQPNELRGLLDEVVKRLVASNIAHIHNYKATPGPRYYKRYMGMSGIENWCVEYNEDYFDQFHFTRVWLVKYLTKQDPPNTSGLLNKLAVVHYQHKKTFLIPLTVPDGEATQEEILFHLQRQIVDVAEQLRSLA